MPRKTGRIGAGGGRGQRGASMRPRPDAAENGKWLGPGRGRPARFNEAAARCRGKLARGALGIRPGPAASMRPRPDAAENLASSAMGNRSRSLQ